MTRLTLIHATQVNGRERSRLLKSTKLPTAPKIVPKRIDLNARCLAKPDAAPTLYAELSNNNIDTVFPSIIAGSDDYFLSTKRSRLFEGRSSQILLTEGRALNILFYYSIQTEN